MKKIIIFAIIGIIMGFIQIRGCIISNYEYNNKIAYAWELADKSSTLDAKSNYITEFVANIEKNKNEFSSYNAVWLLTPDNELEKNIMALKTLQRRLEEI